ncbi:hypothetical protein BD309DRAFT_616761 [Dichomitus squalens]|nr:hypothetical protein BD309DRAFT_616761 [Dichomitus squalens]
MDSRSASSDPMAAIAQSTLTSGLVAFFIESLLFGVFGVTYGICVWILLLRDKVLGGSARNIVLFVASTLMFMLALVHAALDVHVVLNSFVTRGGDVERMSLVFDGWNALSSTLGAAKFGIYVTQVLVGDGFMAYRAYMVWDRSTRVIVLPVILLVGEIFIGYYISLSGPVMMSSLQADTVSCVDALVQAFFIISAVTNLLSTALIMGRILSSSVGTRDANTRDSSRGVKWRVFESILQSAAIYSVASISLAATSFTSPAIAFPALHSVFPSVIGIVFLLIVMRISINAASSNAPSDQPRRSMYQLNGSSCQIPGFSTPAVPTLDVERRNHHNSSPLSSPIAIHVSVSTMSDSESIALSADDMLHATEKMVDEETLRADDAQQSPRSPQLSLSSYHLNEVRWLSYA